VGQGTTIRLYLPRSTQSEDRIVAIDTLPVTGGSEVVLVAEDDESVRETVVALLSDLGYRVLKAKDAHSALNIIESGMPIDVLLTDVIMPGPLRSTELARKARERIPNLAVLFTSGYSENAVVHAGRLDDNVELLSKPYSREALARKLRHVLAIATNRGASSAAAAFEPEFPTAMSSSPRALRILVCEHDELIRGPTVEMLRSVGHLATSARDARAALAILVSEPVDILLTHIGLPDMSGVLLAEYALSRSPGLSVIFTTGRSDDSSMPAHLSERTLIKPFSIDALLAMIATVARADRK
jgi:CheY-like chemotaxis protein